MEELYNVYGNDIGAIVAVDLEKEKIIELSSQEFNSELKLSGASSQFLR